MRCRLCSITTEPTRLRTRGMSVLIELRAVASYSRFPRRSLMLLGFLCCLASSLENEAQLHAWTLHIQLGAPFEGLMMLFLEASASSKLEKSFCHCPIFIQCILQYGRWMTCSPLPSNRTSALEMMHISQSQMPTKDCNYRSLTSALHFPIHTFHPTFTRHGPKECGNKERGEAGERKAIPSSVPKSRPTCKSPAP